MADQKKMDRKPSVPVYRAEILAEVPRQTPASPGRTKHVQVFLHVGRVRGLVRGRGSQQEDPAAERVGVAAQPPMPAGTVQRGGGLQLEEVGSCD